MKKQFAQYMKAKEAMDSMVDRKYPQGLILRWKTGKYAGRECFVKSTFWDDWNHKNKGNPRVMLRVATRSKDGKSFIDDNDSFHRHYHYPENFEVVTK